jgi:hypothetical protein
LGKKLKNLVCLPRFKKKIKLAIEKLQKLTLPMTTMDFFEIEMTKLYCKIQKSIQNASIHGWQVIITQSEKLNINQVSKFPEQRVLQFFKQIFQLFEPQVSRNNPEAKW